MYFFLNRRLRATVLTKRRTALFRTSSAPCPRRRRRRRRRGTRSLHVSPMATRRRFPERTGLHQTKSSATSQHLFFSFCAERAHLYVSLSRDSRLAAEVYKDMPETSFTRTISNPEVVMKRRRQQKLEKRMQEFRGSDGRPDSGRHNSEHLSITRPTDSAINQSIYYLKCSLTIKMVSEHFLIINKLIMPSNWSPNISEKCCVVVFSTTLLLLQIRGIQ